ncbi:hypothetical protein DITRI_Ditri13aG0100300 [Diplodiscus trichospermus]
MIGGTRLLSKAEVQFQLLRLTRPLKLSTEPHYIRCIKPNKELKPEIFECQCLAAVKCQGYPTHRTFAEFLNRFAILAPEILAGNYEENVACKWITEKMGLFQCISEEGKWLHMGASQATSSEKLLGKTMIFLRAGQMAELDAHKAKILGKLAKVVQKQIRSHINRKHYVDMRKASIRMQTAWRGKLAREIYKDMKSEAAAVQIVYTEDHALAKQIIIQSSTCTLLTNCVQSGQGFAIIWFLVWLDMPQHILIGNTIFQALKFKLSMLFSLSTIVCLTGPLAGRKEKSR